MGGNQDILRTTRVVTLWYRPIELLLSDHNADASVKVVDTSSGPKPMFELNRKWIGRENRAAERTPYGTAVDVWSVGCIFGEMLRIAYGEPAFPGKKFLFVL